MKKNSTGHLAAEKKTSGDAAIFWGHVGPLLFLALIFFINFTARIILSPLLPTVERELEISHSQAGFFFLLISIGYFVALMGSGFFSSRLTHRKTIISSCACVGLVLLSISLTNSLWAIRLGLLALGLVAGLYIPSAIATITSLVDSRNWGKAIAVHELAPTIAFLAAPLLAELFLSRLSWRTGLGLMGVTSLIVSLAYIRYGRGGEFPGESPTSGAFKLLLRTPAFWLMLVLFVLGISATLGAFAMLPLYLVSERGMGQSWVNTLIALSRISGPFLGFLGGWVSDKLGPRHTMAGSLFFTGLMTLLLGQGPTSWIIVFVFLQPLLAVWFFPAGFAALSLITPASARNLAVSFTVPFGLVLGGGAIPAFIGLMGDTSSFALGFTLVGGLIFLGGVLALYLKLPDQR